MLLESLMFIDNTTVESDNSVFVYGFRNLNCQYVHNVSLENEFSLSKSFGLSTPAFNID